MFDDHYEGGTLFADKLNVEVTPRSDGTSQVRYGWDSRTPNRSTRSLKLNSEQDAQIGAIPFTSGRVRPGIKGNLRLTITPWNA